MFMKYDVGVVLAHELSNDRTLTLQTRARADRGINALKNKEIIYLLMSGGHASEYGISLADAMAQYAYREGVPRDKIVEENLSLDTIGQIVFCKQGIIDPRGWKNVLFISNDWHASRVMEIARIAFGDGYNLAFAKVRSKNSGEETEERASLALFRKSFVRVPRGNDKAVLERLLTKHRLYSGRARHFREGLEMMKDANRIR